VIRGIGIDVVEVSRIRRAMRNSRFVDRILTTSEQAGNITPSFLAGRWAAKEAVAKAISTKLRWHDVEIHNDDSGRPYVRLIPTGVERDGIVPAPHLLVLADDVAERLHLSISHERGIASAVAVWEDV
jgi:holo-[acyl-carrier protein] synthase